MSARGWKLVGLVGLVGLVAAPAAAREEQERELSAGETSLVRPSSPTLRWLSKPVPSFSTGPAARLLSRAMPQHEAQRVAAFLGPAATGGSGGQVGVLVRPVGSQAAILASNPDLRFEPGSSIKALLLLLLLLLLEAVQAVERGSGSWTDPIAVYAYPNSINSGGDPCGSVSARCGRSAGEPPAGPDAWAGRERDDVGV